MMTKRNRFSQWGYSRLSLQALSLIIAVAVWFFASLDHNAKGYRSVALPVEVVGLKDGFLAEVDVGSVEAKFFGDIEALSSLEPSSLVCDVDVSGLPVGTYRLVPRVRLPKGAEDVTFRPQYVAVTIQRRLSREVSVKVEFGEGFPRDLRLPASAFSVKPKQVLVQGSEEQLKGIEYARVVVSHEDLLGGKKNFPVELVFRKGYSRERDLELSPKEVALDAPASSDRMVVRVPLRASVEGMPEWGFSVDEVKVIPDTVALQGSPEALGQVTVIDLPPVSVEGAAGDFSAWVPIKPPLDGVTVLGDGIAQVQVKLVRKPSKRVLKGLPVRIQGANGGVEWNLSPSEVDVTVALEGDVKDPNLLSAPPSDLVEVYVDASNVVTSRITLPVLAKPKRDSLMVLSVDPPRVLLQEKR